MTTPEAFHLVSLFLPIGLLYTIGEALSVAPFIQWQEKQLVHASMFRVGRNLMITAVDAARAFRARVK